MRLPLFEFAESVRMALVTIWANKLRALLTTLGIIIGIVSVTAMFTTINGIERAFDRSVAMLGTNVVNVQRMPDGFTVEWWRYRNRPRLTEGVSEAVAERAETIASVAPVAFAVEPVTSGRQRLDNIFIRASTPALADVTGLDLDQGRFFGETDHRAARPVAVIGQTVAEELFPAGSPLGKHIRIGGQRFEVIGVLVEQGKFLGLFSFDEQVVIPLTTYKKWYESEPDLVVQAKVREGVPMEAAMDELTGVVRVARGLDPIEEEDFALSPQDSFRQQLAGVTGAIYAVGLFLTGLSLLVGGIGVMNIMFVSVKERTREIGIRKALGATRRAILAQFLVEAVVVCMIGGVIGIALSAGVTALINQVFTAYLSPFTVALAFFICVGVGVVFGFIPAWSAARAHPIEALRYE
ncbi:MAG TPA: ABC transporter permease [Rubricoccaceae bacterium]|nr:ABC transporter permease [Rubricoccaceae bacterium]